MNDIVRRYLPRLHDVATTRLSRILSLLGDADTHADAIASEFHTLAGEAGLLGLSKISTVAREAEQAARALTGKSSQVVVCAKAVRNIRKQLQSLVGPAPHEPPPARAPSSAHVLVVDDSQVVSGHLCDALEDAGLQASAAQDHKTATELARTKQPSVVLIDVMMECGDVRDLCPTLRELCGAKTSLILVSGMQEDELAALADEVGASGFIAKSQGVQGIVERACALAGEVTQ